MRDAFGLVIDDLVDRRLPDLQHFEISATDFIDAITPGAIAALGLAPSYPSAIPHPPCQGIAEEAYAKNEHGVASLSAVSPLDEELVLFDRDVATVTRKTVRLKFSSWY